MAMDTITIKDGTGANQTVPVHTDAAGGVMFVHSTDGSEAVYSAGGTVLAAAMAASLTDLVVLRGSATKTVRVKKLRVECGATTGATVPVLIQKHSTANTGGTAITTPAMVPLDANDAAASALPLVYSANPTVGTALTLAGRTLCTAALTTAPGVVEIDFVRELGHAVVLRGVAQELAVNFGATTPGAGAVLSWHIVWSEETE